MLKLAYVIAVFYAVVYAYPPHHQFALSSDKDVKHFGELLEEVAVVFEKGNIKLIVLNHETSFQSFKSGKP